MAAEKATSPKRAASESDPKKPESIPKERDLSPETIDQTLLVESVRGLHQAAPHIRIARCRVLPFRLLYKRKDFLASNSNIDSDNDFGDTGMCANCNLKPEEGTKLNCCAGCHVTRYCSTDCQKEVLRISQICLLCCCQMGSNKDLDLATC